MRSLFLGYTPTLDVLAMFCSHLPQQSQQLRQRQRTDHAVAPQIHRRIFCATPLLRDDWGTQRKMAEALSGKLCSTPNCGKPSKLMCPKCVELNISSPFCSQDCFKGNYKAHNEVHKAGLRSPQCFLFPACSTPHT